MSDISFEDRYRDPLYWYDQSGERLFTPTMSAEHMTKCLPYIRRALNNCRENAAVLDDVFKNSIGKRNDVKFAERRLSAHQAVQRLDAYEHGFCEILKAKNANNKTKNFYIKKENAMSIYEDDIREDTFTSDEFNKAINLVDAKARVKIVDVKFTDSGQTYTYKIRDDLYDMVDEGDFVVVQGASGSYEDYAVAEVVRKNVSLYSVGIQALTKVKYKWVIDYVNRGADAEIRERQNRIIEAFAVSEVENQVDAVISKMTKKQQAAIGMFTDASDDEESEPTFPENGVDFDEDIDLSDDDIYEQD